MYMYGPGSLLVMLCNFQQTHKCVRMLNTVPHIVNDEPCFFLTVTVEDRTSYKQ